MEVRIAEPVHLGSAPLLVIYATGDGGWHGVDDQVFDWIASSGLPIAGFSSRNYLKNLGYFSETDTTTPRRLVRDYRQIIAFVRSRLRLPEETPILLAGNSRGAGLSVVAAGQGELKPHLAGVLAIALTKEEEHILHSRTSRRMRAGQQPSRFEVKTYEYLPRLSSFPVCVIQSTNDKYVPAEEARRLFGPDGELRRFRPVDSRNHSFSGGREKLRSEVASALSWIAGALADRTRAAH